MKKLSFLFLVLLCGFTFNLNAQYMKLDASFYSKALDEIKKVDIFLPNDYYENLEQEYAVIYYLHGAGGDQNTGQTTAMRYYLLHNLDTTITSPAALFVCPDGSCEPYSGSDYVNSELYGNYADYTTADLIEFIENNFRVIPSREFRFVCGTSMGGFGSAYHALNNLELFRANFPFIGFPAVTNDFILLWKDLVYEENGSYTDISYNAGKNSRLVLTMAGGLSPNLSMPNFVELPWDSIGELVDSVMAKWKQFDASNMVRDIPQDNNLAFFLGCGLTDYMGTYSLYGQFMDSLDFYGIPYQSNFFDGGHVDDFETWKMGLHWMDSIINYSYQTMGIEIIQMGPSPVNIFPNPATHTLHISWQSENNGPATLRIYNQLGQQTGSEIPLNTSATNNDFAIDISSFKKGIYFLQMAFDGKMVTKKFVKY